MSDIIIYTLNLIILILLLKLQIKNITNYDILKTSSLVIILIIFINYLFNKYENFGNTGTVISDPKYMDKRMLDIMSFTKDDLFDQMKLIPDPNDYDSAYNKFDKPKFGTDVNFEYTQITKGYYAN